MKRKATSHAKKPAKKKVVAKKRVVSTEPKEEEISVIEHAKHEKEASKSEQARSRAMGDGRKYTRQVFELWMTIPDQFKGAPERIVALLGITDSIMLELIRIPTMQAFADEFGVIPQTLSRWRGEMENDSDFLVDVKKQLRRTTRNVLGSLYRKVLEEGDAPRVMAWMKIVEDWREHLAIDPGTPVGDGLSVEEKMALDHLLEKNSMRV